MKILMMTNTYLPHIGGVARSVASFTQMFRQWGDRVMVIAPQYGDAIDESPDVVRVPAIQHFNGSDFAVRLPLPGLLWDKVEAFAPDLVHSHHPFLLGDTALRVAAWHELPLVFTHHTMYERYTHYVPGDSPLLKRFAMRLATEYANLCDHVIAPSESIKAVLGQRGVRAPISAVPTGIDPDRFAAGDGGRARASVGIPRDALVVGHVGRLALEKNLAFLARCIAPWLAERSGAHALIVGEGPADEVIRESAAYHGVSERVHLLGSRSGQALVDAYHAMDGFAFASQTETQGMVLAEAMAAGVPVIALDAPGAREIVRDGVNGWLIEDEADEAFLGALRTLAAMGDHERTAMQARARETARCFALPRCAARMRWIYKELLAAAPPRARSVEDNPWTQVRRWFEVEWNLWEARSDAALESFREGA